MCSFPADGTDEPEGQSFRKCKRIVKAFTEAGDGLVRREGREGVTLRDAVTLIFNFLRSN
jgi:hypothetical protein